MKSTIISPAYSFLLGVGPGLAGSVGKPAVPVVVAGFPLPQPLLLLQALGLLHPLAFLSLPVFL